MPEIELAAGPVDYRDRGHGPVLVFLHGVWMPGEVWDPVVARLEGRFRCIVPTLPLGSHRQPMRPEADLSLLGYGALVEDLLDRLGLTEVTLIGNDHAAVLAAAVRRPQAVTRLVITSCEAFENYPPGRPGRSLRLAAFVPGGLLLAAAVLRLPVARRLLVSRGGLAKRPLPDAVVRRWFTPGHRDPRVLADLRRYLAGSRRSQMVELCSHLPEVAVPTLVVWTPEDRLQDPGHGRRIADLIPGARLVELADSHTLSMWDQPARLAQLVAEFAAAPSRTSNH